MPFTLANTPAEQEAFELGKNHAAEHVYKNPFIHISPLRLAYLNGYHRAIEEEMEKVLRELA